MILDGLCDGQHNQHRVPCSGFHIAVSLWRVLSFFSFFPFFLHYIHPIGVLSFTVHP